MKFGIGIYSRAQEASPDNLVLVAQRAEEMGFDMVCVGDHIAIPHSYTSPYPYSATGDFTKGGSADWMMEHLTVLAFLAAKTRRIRLAPSVMVLPHRNPLVAAKVLATLDVLSKGRLAVGVGVGWLKEEFEAVELPPFEERGAVSSEYLRAFKELWTKDNPSFQGRYCSFSDIRFEPKPAQKPHPPIWVGGESPGAMRRAAALGDAWHPIGSNPRYPLKTPEQLKAAMDRLAHYAVEAGRDPSQIELAYRVHEYRLTNEGHLRPFVGNADHIAEDIRAFAAVGAKHLVFSFLGDNAGETLTLMDQFAREIMPKVNDC